MTTKKIAKFISVVLTILILITSIQIPQNSYAATTISAEAQKILDTINSEIEGLYGISNNYFMFKAKSEDGKQRVLNENYLFNKNESISDMKMLIYGKPFYHDVEKDKMEVNGVTEYRYLGYSVNGDEYTNMNFPNYSYSGFTLVGLSENRGKKAGNIVTDTLVKKPWTVGSKNLDTTSGTTRNLDDKFMIMLYGNNGENTENKKKLNEQIKEGIKQFYPEYINNKETAENIQKYEHDKEKFNSEDFDLTEYVHIYQMPTYTCWGMGAIWHSQVTLDTAHPILNIYS